MSLTMIASLCAIAVGLPVALALGLARTSARADDARERLARELVAAPGSPMLRAIRSDRGGLRARHGSGPVTPIGARARRARGRPASRLRRR